MNTFSCIPALLLAILLCAPQFVLADGEGKKEEQAYKFEIQKTIPHTPVRDQGRSGTCWSFGASSFFEAELMRLGRGSFDLSEMFVVRNVYSAKARPYVRYHGAFRFGEGSLPRDWIETARRSGMVPESVYDGKRIGKNAHDHSEMSEILVAMLKALSERRELTPRWKEAYEAILDVYLGAAPEIFEYEGRTYTPRSFFDGVLNLDLSAYVELTSYTHQPFYAQMVLEIPDNWARYGHYYNLPIDELDRVALHALQNGYGVCWDADVSEQTFFRQGYAVVPEKDWQDTTEDEKQEIR
jgi:bleomycin hydrolase